MSIQNKKVQKNNVNYNIRSQYCRVIEDNIEPRIMATREAIEYAKSKNLDLIEIGYDKANQCSNCKVGDYSKYIYNQKKREKLAKKQARQAQVDIKSIQFSLTTDTADKKRFIEHAKQFLEEGNKVKLAIRFRNRREMTNIDLAKTLMREILNELDSIALLDSTPALNGKELSCILRRAK
jgi:translation initiation factor IF-3